MITTTEIYGYGLTTGLSYTEMRCMRPGFVMDMIIVRRKYLSSMFGNTKKKKL